MRTTQEFFYSVNLMRSILWQYEGAPKMVQLSKKDQDFIDSANKEFWEDWNRDVFNLKTANDFGLAVWARILDAPLTIRNEALRVNVFGFGVNHRNFENGGFGRGIETETLLDTESARQFLLLRWVKLTMRPTIPNINKALMDIFGPGRVYVTDSYDMTFASYTFKQAVNYKVRRLLEQTDVLPRPSTVGTEWEINIDDSFGFGPDDLNFDNGNFGEFYDPNL